VTKRGTLVASAIAVSVALAIYVCVLNRPWSSDCYTREVCDAQTFLVVGEMLASGGNPYSTTDRATHVSATRLGGERPPYENPFQYPPHALPLFAALEWLRPSVGVTGFIALTTAGFLLALAVLLVQERLQIDSTLVLLAAFGLGGMSALNAALGQTGAAAAGLATGALLMWQRSPMLAGCLLGLLTFKPQYAVPLLVVAMAQKSYRLLAVASTITGLLILASGALFGFGQWARFLSALTEVNRSSAMMASWVGPATWLTTSPVPVALAAGIYAAFVPAAFLVASRMRGLEAYDVAAVALVWGLLLSPNAHPYDTLAAAPTVCLLARRFPGQWMGLVILAGSWLAMPFRWMVAPLLAVCAIAGLHLLSATSASSPHGTPPPEDCRP